MGRADAEPRLGVGLTSGRSSPLLKELEGAPADIERRAAELLNLRPAQVAEVTRYYAEFPAEVEECIARNARAV